jgi:membrane fusion protein (multidrug efflux system)
MSENTSVNGAPGGKKKIILRIVLAGIVMGIGYFIYKNYMTVGTDDAYVQAHSLMLAPRIGGTVAKVMVKENDRVTMGQVLAQFDDRDYMNAYNQANAELEAAQADLAQAEKDFKRVSGLFKAAAVSHQQYDAAVARFHNLTARVQSSRIKSDQANLNLSYTQITAPDNGVIAKKSVEPGMVVPPGQALFGFVGSSERWVTANFKETQLSKIKLGQKVQVEVDAVSGKKFQGEVESIGPSTGSTFTLLPPDNSTGNFTKVVQRVPVKIKLLNLTASDIDRLAAGLSAVVSVKIH